MKKVSVGRTDAKKLDKQTSGLNRIAKQRKFNTLEEAISFISNIKDQKSVLNGDFYIDAPEMTRFTFVYIK